MKRTINKFHHRGDGICFEKVSNGLINDRRHSLIINYSRIQEDEKKFFCN